MASENTGVFAPASCEAIPLVCEESSSDRKIAVYYQMIYRTIIPYFTRNLKKLNTQSDQSAFP